VLLAALAFVPILLSANATQKLTSLFVLVILAGFVVSNSVARVVIGLAALGGLAAGAASRRRGRRSPVPAALAEAAAD